MQRDIHVLALTICSNPTCHAPVQAALIIDYFPVAFNQLKLASMKMYKQKNKAFQTIHITTALDDRVLPYFYTLRIVSL